MFGTFWADLIFGEVVDDNAVRRGVKKAILILFIRGCR